MAAPDAEEGLCDTDHIGADGASHRRDMDVVDDSVHGVTHEARGKTADEVNI